MFNVHINLGANERRKHTLNGSTSNVQRMQGTVERRLSRELHTNVADKCFHFRTPLPKYMLILMHTHTHKYPYIYIFEPRMIALAVTTILYINHHPQSASPRGLQYSLHSSYRKTPSCFGSLHTQHFTAFLCPPADVIPTRDDIMIKKQAIITIFEYIHIYFSPLYASISICTLTYSL